MLNLAGIDKLACCRSERIGAGTIIRPFAVVIESATIGDDCHICSHTTIGGTVGNRCTIKDGAKVYEGVVVEDDCFIGPGVLLLNDKHPMSPRANGYVDFYANEDNWMEPCKIERGASIGAGAIILPGVTIGQFATVGAGAVVTRNVHDGGTVIGIPARDYRPVRRQDHS